MILDPTKLDLLKEPFGTLIRDNEVTIDLVTEILKKAPKVIAVGDTTTEKLVGFGFIPDISVTDCMEKRVIKASKFEYPVDKTIHLDNKPGELSEQVVLEVKKLILANAYDSKIRIIIKGEEDLVALPFLMYSPNDWVICYGQPNEGLVIVQVTEDSKKKAMLIFNKAFI
ncbi:GTP-dependent dephospho-CoA kinase family protein [Candidatus Nitrosocosmicus sp. FF01]|uniref:GTP-dependent dephospho-CoA kinase family protein n=1 Tax=Candidatus Nitrosocosmicus sp. FF01 TaxID=3397670 RepID=UPI0039EBFD12